MGNKFVIVLAITAIAISSCGSPEKKSSEKAVVSVSILPQEYFVRQLAGDLVEVNVLVPEGASPATYEPSVSQLSLLDRSALYLSLGYLGFELAWMDKIQSVNPGLKVVDLSRGMALIGGHGSHEHGHGHDHVHDSGGVDPHYWMSLSGARIVSKHTYEALLDLLPDQGELLESRMETLSGKLDSLDAELRHMLQDVEERAFMIYHPALAYFGRDYGFEQHSLELEGKEPSPAHMKALSDLARMEGISVIFIQREFDQRNARVLAEETGARLISINPLARDWEQEMRHIAACLIPQE
jgi:zinc transport system substrate-binding protein